MKIDLNLLNKRLTPQIRGIVEGLSAISKRLNIKLYLVGGPVRDLLLKRDAIDLDFLIDSSLDKFLESVESDLDVEIEKTSFLTAKFKFSQFVIDIAQARKEIYLNFGDLPQVSPATLEEDAKRRDFTINSLMLEIKDGCFVELIDYLKGVEDLNRKIIRVIGKNSFYDDSTRIIRALRYEKRFNFTLADDTFEQLKSAISKNVFSTLSVQRLGAEFLRTLKEENITPAIMRLWQLTAGGFLTGDIEITPKMCNLLKKWDKLKKCFELDDLWLISLIIIYKDINLSQFNLIAEALELKKLARRIITDLKSLDLEEFLTSISKRLSKVEIYDRLKSIDTHLIAYFYLISRGKAKTNLRTYIDKISKVKITITGEDILAAGIAEGPHVGSMLEKVLRAKIRGELRNRKDEINYLKTVILD
ncbi:MAG: hypothetical protein P9M06_04875 [Candidatus Saelkia tenebricola]|nr:hypothetical protein [Candidatus Saelkia tenebricola]